MVLDLIEKKIFKNYGYDSEQFRDIKENLLIDLNKLYQNPTLKLIIDAYAIIFANSGKGSIYLEPQQPFSPEKFTGSYMGKSEKIYLYNTDNREGGNLASILIHEMTHAVMDKFYGNFAKPFSRKNDNSKSAYQEKLLELMLLPLKIFSVFTKPYELKNIDSIHDPSDQNLLNIFIRLLGENKDNQKVYGDLLVDLKQDFSLINFIALYQYNNEFIEGEVIARYFENIAVSDDFKVILSPISVFVKNYLAKDIQKLYSIAKPNQLTAKFTELNDDDSYEDFIAQSNFFDALITNNIQVMQSYIDKGYNINHKILFFTPLEIAIKLQNLDTLQFLLSNANINEAFGDLLMSCFTNKNLDIEVLELLLQSGIKDIDNKALIAATKIGLIDVVELLISNNFEQIKLDINLQNKLFEIALENQHGEVVEYLYQNNFECDDWSSEYFFKIGSITKELVQNFKINEYTNPNLLFETIKINNFDGVKLLISKGINVNVFEVRKRFRIEKEEYNYHKTPLDLALEIGNEEIANLLIESGAVVNFEQYCMNNNCEEGSIFKQDKVHNSLVWAVIGGNPYLIKKMLEYGFDPLDPLVINRATEYGSFATLVEAKIGKSLQNLLDTPIKQDMIAEIRTEQNQLLGDWLLDTSSEDNDKALNIQNLDALVVTQFKSSSDEEIYPLFNAVIEGNIQDIKLLLFSGADPYYSQEIPRYAFDRKISFLENYKTFGEFLRSSAIGARSEDLTPLHLAAVMNRSDIIDLFLSYGCDVNYHVIYNKWSSQPTMLHIASYMHNEELVGYLLKHGADPNINLPSLSTAIYQVSENDSLSILNPDHVKNRLNIFKKLVENGSHLFEVNKGEYFFSNPIESIFRFLMKDGYDDSLKEIHQYLTEDCNISSDILDSMLLSGLGISPSLSTVKMLDNMGVKFEHFREITNILYVAIAEDKTEMLDLILGISQITQENIISLMESQNYKDISHKKELFCPILLKHNLKNALEFCDNYKKDTWIDLIEDNNDELFQEQIEVIDSSELLLGVN